MNCERGGGEISNEQIKEIATKLQSGTVSLSSLHYSDYYVEKWTTQLWYSPL